MLTKKQMQSLPAGRHLIEPNLYLRVRSATSKYFTFKYALNGSRKELTLGKFEDLTVSQAREQVAKCRLLLAKGIDPKFAKEKQKKSIKDVQGSSSKALFNFAPRELLSITQSKFLCKRLFRVLLKSFLSKNS